MIKNPKALMTLIRNKLMSNLSFEEKLKWFHEKGITVVEEDGSYFLKSDPRGHISELTDVCNGIIFHPPYLVAFPGWQTQEISLTELKQDKNFIFDETTIFIEPLDDGQTIYMFWDPAIGKWCFSSPKKIKSPYEDIVSKIIKNVMSGEYCYTYTLKLVESGENKGLYLESLFDHERFKEESLERVIQFAQKFDIKYSKLYRLEKNNIIEESDLPIIVRDISGHKYKITKI